MSRIGKLHIAIPAGVTVEQKDNILTVKGPKGELKQTLNPNITVEIEDNEIKVTPGQERNLYLSLRNVPTASVVTASDINTYRVLDNRMILVTESSVDALNNLK